MNTVQGGTTTSIKAALLHADRGGSFYEAVKAERDTVRFRNRFGAWYMKRVDGYWDCCGEPTVLHRKDPNIVLEGFHAYCLTALEALYAMSQGYSVAKQYWEPGYSVRRDVTLTTGVVDSNDKAYNFNPFGSGYYAVVVPTLQERGAA